MSSAGKAPSLASVLEEQKQYLALTETGTRIKCLLTTHEMPARVDAVLSYLNGSKFKKAKEWYTQDYSKYLPFIIPDKKDDHRLFCKLTRLKLNKIPKEVEKHVNGQRFKRLKESYEARESRRQQGDEDNDEDNEEGEEEDQEEDEEGDEEDIDVDEEAGKAAAAGVWLPVNELRELKSMIKLKGGGSKRKVTVEQEEEEEEEEEEAGEAGEAGEAVEFGEGHVDSDDSDADLRFYVREAPVATKKKAKDKDKDKGGGKRQKSNGVGLMDLA